jgi:hypothetical protein
MDGRPGLSMGLNANAPHLAMRGALVLWSESLEQKKVYLIVIVAVPCAPVISNESPDFLPSG